MDREKNTDPHGEAKLAAERWAALKARPAISDAELERRRHEPEFSTEEVISYLERLKVT